MRTNPARKAPRGTFPTIRPAIYTLKGGVLYARCSLSGKEIVRRSATIVLTLGGKPIELIIGKRRKKVTALAVKPLIKHSLGAKKVGLLSLLVTPDHPHYPAFRAIGGAGTMPIPRARFAQYDREIHAAYRGALNLKEAQRLFESIVNTTVALLPAAKPLDPRLPKVIRLLRRDPNHALEDIADTVGISYHRMSHLFADSIGLPLRSYRLWQKEANVALLLESGYTLKRAAHEAGFRDAMHLCRVFRQAYGAPPSYIYHNQATQYFSVSQPGRQRPPGKKS